MAERHRSPDDLMTATQVAEYLQLHKLTIYKYIREGRLPAVRLGRSLRIMKADVDRFLEERKETPEPGPPATRRRGGEQVREAQPARVATAVKHSEEIYVGPSREEHVESRDGVVTVNPLEWVIRGLH